MKQPTRTNSPSIDATFGSRLTSARETRGLSQRALATRLSEAGLSLDASALSRIENGTRPVKLSEAATIADVLHMNLESIVRGFTGPEKALDRAISEVSATLIDLKAAAVRYLMTQKELANELMNGNFTDKRGIGLLSIGLAQVAEMAELEAQAQIVEEIRQIADFASQSQPDQDWFSEYLRDLREDPAWSVWLERWTIDFFDSVQEVRDGEHQEER